MKKVTKENGSFQLLPEEDQKMVMMAVKEHENDLRLVKEDPTLEQAMVVIEHLLCRLREIEKKA